MENDRSLSDFEQRQCVVSLPVSLIAHSHVTKIAMGVDCVMPIMLIEGAHHLCDVLTVLTRNSLQLWKSLAQRIQSENSGPLLLLVERPYTTMKLLLVTSSPTATILALD